MDGQMSHLFTANSASYPHWYMNEWQLTECELLGDGLLRVTGAVACLLILLTYSQLSLLPSLVQE